jgi:AcrR family transcriptional regulator
MSSEHPSRARMIDAAIHLMRISGLSGAGINEIVRESGAPKGSVYHFFPAGKSQIVTEALAVYGDRVGAFIDSALAAGESPDQRVRALFAAFAERVEAGAFQSSCAAGALSLDLDVGHEELRATLVTTFSGWQAIIAGHFPELPAAQRDSFAGFVLTAIEGAYVRCRAEHSSRPFCDAGEWIAQVAASGSSHDVRSEH